MEAVLVPDLHEGMVGLLRTPFILQPEDTQLCASFWYVHNGNTNKDHLSVFANISGSLGHHLWQEKGKRCLILPRCSDDLKFVLFWMSGSIKEFLTSLSTFCPLSYSITFASFQLATLICGCQLLCQSLVGARDLFRWCGRQGRTRGMITLQWLLMMLKLPCYLAMLLVCIFFYHSLFSVTYSALFNSIKQATCKIDSILVKENCRLTNVTFQNVLFPFS